MTTQSVFPNVSSSFTVNYSTGAVGSRVLDNKIIHVKNDQIRFSRYMKDVDAH